MAHRNGEFTHFNTVDEMVAHLEKPAIYIALAGNAWIDMTHSKYIGNAEELIQYINTNGYRVENLHALTDEIKNKLAV